ncbi:MAG: hypothetical protein M3O30_12835 [Planctomycetota bacterium]|nr:hypothetical protein [Planctomycetota bacterium]
MVFEVRDESSGQAEACPSCQVINEIPEDSMALETEPQSEEPISPADQVADVPTIPASAKFAPIALEASRGLPAAIWWALAIAAVAAFSLCIFLLFTDDWERQHLQFLTATSQHADALMIAGDFAGATKEYQRVLDTVGNKKMQSVYLRNLVESARHSEQAAEMGAGLAQSMPQRIAQASAATLPASGPSDVQLHAATRNFQRATEYFSTFVSSHPILIRDDHQQFRRRQFLVWDVSYQLHQESDPPQISLQFDAGARTTNPHRSGDDATVDGDFPHDDFQTGIPIQTQFVLREGRWVVSARHVNNDQGIQVISDGLLRPGNTSMLDGLFDLEEKAFGGEAPSGK